MQVTPSHTLRRLSVANFYEGVFNGTLAKFQEKDTAIDTLDADFRYTHLFFWGGGCLLRKPGGPSPPPKRAPSTGPPRSNRDQPPRARGLPRPRHPKKLKKTFLGSACRGGPEMPSFALNSVQKEWTIAMPPPPKKTFEHPTSHVLGTCDDSFICCRRVDDPSWSTWPHHIDRKR